jgi:hypothetical protein
MTLKMKTKLSTRKSPRKSGEKRRMSRATGISKLKRTITPEKAEGYISSYDKRTKKLMQDSGLDVGNTPYANEARKERSELLYDLLKSNFDIKNSNPRLGENSKNSNISRR